MHLLRHTALASVMFLACGLAAAQSYPPPQNVVALSSSAELEVTKDLLTVTLNATRDGAEAAGVQAALKQVLDAALNEAKKSALPGAMEVRTGNFSLYPRYSRDGRISGWQGTAELVLEGLHQHLKLAREDLDSRVSYKEALKFTLLKPHARGTRGRGEVN